MTVALAIRVGKGLVLAADSRISLVADGPHDPERRQFYRHDGWIVALRSGFRDRCAASWATISALTMTMLLRGPPQPGRGTGHAIAETGASGVAGSQRAVVSGW